MLHECRFWCYKETESHSKLPDSVSSIHSTSSSTIFLRLKGTSVLYMYLLGQSFTTVHFHWLWFLVFMAGDWRGIAGCKWNHMVNSKRGNFRMKIERWKKEEVSNIIIKKFEKVIRSHIINYLHKQTLQYTKFNVYIYSQNIFFKYGMTMVPPKAKVYLTETLILGMKSLLLSSWTRISKRRPNHTICCSYPSLPTRGGKIVTITGIYTLQKQSP